LTSSYIAANTFPPHVHCTVDLFGDSFLLVGETIDYNAELSTIYHYNPVEDIWTLLDERMKEEKYI
jgi:hypothetical protein